MGIVISGTGSYLPERVIDNHELESMTSDFDRARSGCTLDEWVTEWSVGRVAAPAKK